MENIQKIILDLNGCKRLGELHERIRKAFDFPEWYGKNWDAFWDLIDGARNNTIIEIKGISTLPEDLSSDIKMMLEILERNKKDMLELKKRHPEFDCRFDYIIID